MGKERSPVNSGRRRRYAKEFKLEAVRLLERGQKRATDLALELGIRRNQLYKWQRELRGKGEYLALGLDDERRRAAYRGLFSTDLDHQLLRDIRISTHGGYAIGSSRFREDIEHALNQRATPRSRGRQAGAAVAAGPN